MIGRVLNKRYKIVERVGIGGMAEVYRAQDTVLDRIVAVKVMLPQYAADETFQKRFKQEAASAAKLSSPYIVSIYDWGLDDDTYYIVMEFIRGTDLKTAIKERGAINQRKAAEIGSQVAQALSVAHEGGIIHRDIKPQNIMIQPDGNIKVMDFGIARAGDAGLSQTSTVLGTAHYVSPEQAQGKELSGSSDIYSLGVVLYEATTGKLPFEGDDAVSVAIKQVNEQPLTPRTINPEIDPALEAIILCAMDKNPDNRFKTASDMRTALIDYLAGRPVNLPAAFMATQLLDGVNDAETAPLGQGETTRLMPNVASDTTQTKLMGTNSSSSKKKRKKGPIIAGIIAAIAVIAIIVGIIAVSNQGEQVEVPNVENEVLSEAEFELKAAGFEIGDVTEVYNSDIASGNVISTNPGAGQTAKKGSSVNITVSKGTEMITVPDLTGLTKDEAIKALSNVGLNGVEGDSIYSDNVEADLVASQDPGSGSSLAKGESVTFHLSKGSDLVEVPDVVGSTKSNAQSALENAGFSVSVNYDYSSSVSEGRVISQSATGSAKRGATITITVSNGPEDTSISIPNVAGMKESDATAALASAGFKYDVVEEASDSVSKGVVIRQNKTGSGNKGDTIRIYVSSGPSSDTSSSSNSSSNTSTSTDNTSSSSSTTTN